jgi:4-amino-4-deoxy-L-arabinose transferase-like glycosyltransferase
MNRVKILLLFIVILAAFLRLYQLGKTPLSLEWDEVAIGYDAYSILKTGRDQFGQFLPMTFRSLDDYKPPIYEYTTVPSIALFGLNEFSVRFPSALFGILAIISTFWLTRLICAKIPEAASKKDTIALFASFFLSISPWHLQFSRAAFEVNLSVFITILAVASFIKGLTNNKFFILSAVLFGLDLFSYHSTRVVTPILLVCLFLLSNRQLPNKKVVGSFFLIYAIFFIGFLPILFSPDAQIRFKATNIFNPGARYLEEKDLEKEFLDKRLEDKKIGFELAGKIFHNQRLIYTDYETLKKAFFKYLSHFNFEYLFIKGDAPLHHAPDFGLLYLWEFPFLIIGVIFILKKGLNRYSVIPILWTLIAPIPTAVTREAPHAVRTELILPSFQLIEAFGIIYLFSILKKESKWVCILFIFIASFSLVVNHAFYLHQYYVHTNYELSKNWLYGRKEAVEFTEKEKEKYDNVLVSLKVDMPYIFWLFYSQYPPEKYLKEGGTISGGFADERNKFDKYEFRNFDYQNLPKDKRLLLVGTPRDFPPDARVLKTIHYLDGTEALKIAEN